MTTHRPHDAAAVVNASWQVAARRTGPLMWDHSDDLVQYLTQQKLPRQVAAIRRSAEKADEPQSGRSHGGVWPRFPFRKASSALTRGICTRFSGTSALTHISGTGNASSTSSSSPARSAGSAT